VHIALKRVQSELILLAEAGKQPNSYSCTLLLASIDFHFYFLTTWLKDTRQSNKE
jgi:hypothetical protein